MLQPTFPTLQSACVAYRPDAAGRKVLYDSFTTHVEATDYLLRHRLHVEEDKLGFGDRAFHWLWKLVVDAMPARFRFLEIGVYKGQVTSLVSMLALRTGREAYVYGITPLSTASDKYSGYDDVDYRVVIDRLEEWCAVPVTHRARMIAGYSTDDDVKRAARLVGPFDLVYIDGGHDYHVVVNDIITFAELVAPGGLLLMDDASTELEFPPEIWRGHPDVGRAVREVLTPDDRFEELLAIGHVRMWRKRDHQSLPSPLPVPLAAAAAGTERINLALGRPSRQSSISEWSSSSNPSEAASGGNNGRITGKMGFHTATEHEPWWQVDLGDVHPLHEAVVYNRIDAVGCEHRAARLHISLSADGQDWRAVYARADDGAFGGADGAPLRVTLDGVSARFVRVWLPGTQTLHLDEVEIY